MTESMFIIYATVITSFKISTNRFIWLEFSIAK